MPWSVDRLGRALLVAGFTALLLAAVVVLGQVPLGRAGGPAVLRVALRTVQGRVEICRERTAEELAALPQHMRQARDCRERSPDYRLTVMVDGREVLAQRVAPGGLRGDRPLIVDRRVELAPGRVALEVELAPVVAEGLDAEGREAFRELPRFLLRETVELVSDRITLVTLDDARGVLEVERSG